MPTNIMAFCIVGQMKPFELLDALMTESSLGERPLAKAMGRLHLQPAIWRFRRGRTQEPERDTTEPLAAFFKVPVDAFYDEKIATKIAKERGLDLPERVVVPTVKESRSSTSQSKRPALAASINPTEQPLKWGELKMLVPLPATFVVELQDDAMAEAGFPAGTLIQFDTSIAPVYGNRVLIRDAQGEYHFRSYAQHPTEAWEGRPTHPDFLKILPSQGAVIVAVKAGHFVKGP